MVSPLAPQQFQRTPNFGEQLLGAVAQGQGIAQNRQAMQMNDQTMQMRDQAQQQEVTELQYQQALRQAEVFNRLAKHARSLPTPEAREQFKQSINQDVLLSVGLTPEQVQEVRQSPVDDASLDSLIAQTQAVLPQQQGTAGEREFASMTSGLSKEDREKARRIQLGLDPRAVGSAAITTATTGLTDTVAGSEATIAGAKSGSSETAKLAAQLDGLPKVKSAVLQAEQQVKELGDKRTKAAQDQITMNMYQSAMAGLAEGLEGTTTGAIAGRLPAITANQQIAEGAVAAIAPILKATFRTAGEGTFTDKDQELLLAMVPTRKDVPEARAAKINNINAIIAAKLSGANMGGSGQGAATPGMTERTPASSRYQIEVLP